MAALTEVDVAPLAPERFESVLDPEQYDSFRQTVDRSRAMFEGRTIWNVNSTAAGGGVAEMLGPLLAYARGAGVDARWIVISGNADFFRVTKRIHNHLHGATGDGGGLGRAEHDAYEGALEPNVSELAARVGPDDVVLLHDPQTAGMVPRLSETGALVVWRCHVGLDMANDIAREAWSFLTPYVTGAAGHIFSREAFSWEGLDRDKITIIPPSIDAFSPKNQDLDRDTVQAILNASGLVRDGARGRPLFTQVDGSEAEVTRQAEIFEDAPLAPDDRVVLQVSRWDRLKDPLGVINGFAEHVAPSTDAHLVYAGPAVAAVSDDPEGAEVLSESHAAWEALPADVRRRVHLAALPMDDGQENAAIVNALQRYADVVVQKSIAEGFGLTVSEAMWKARPVVGTRIGGIQDQIVDGETGYLVDDPRDLEAYGTAVTRLLEDPEGAERIGGEAQRRVRDEFLGARHLAQYLALFQRLRPT